MTKNKLITVRIESEKRENFTKWAKTRNIDASVFLYGVIEACIDGRVDEGILDKRLDEQQLDDRIDERIRQLEDKLDKRIDNKLDNVVSEAVETAIASLRDELDELKKPLALEREAL